MIRIAAIKFANAIRIDKEMQTFLEEGLYDISADRDIIRVASRRNPGSVTFTSLYNTIYYVESEVAPEVSPQELIKFAKKSGRGV